MGENKTKKQTLTSVYSQRTKKERSFSLRYIGLIAMSLVATFARIVQFRQMLFVKFYNHYHLYLCCNDNAIFQKFTKKSPVLHSYQQVLFQYLETHLTRNYK